MFGRAVVHGIHAALWGLDVWLEGQTDQLALRSLRATFQSAIGLGEEVRCFVERLPDNRVDIELRVGDAPAAWMEFEWVSRRGRPPETIARRAPERSVCRALSYDQVTTASGIIDPCLSPENAASVFPNL